MDELSQMLQDDMIKLQDNIAKSFSKRVADELTNETRIAIDDFYNQYDPENPSLHHGRIYYYRHWNFKKSFRRYRNRYVGGVELLSDSIPDVYSGKNSSPQSVFDRVYLGLHGIASLQNYGVPRLKPSPFRRILEKQNYIVNHTDDYVNAAIDEALSSSYKLL